MIFLDIKEENKNENTAYKVRYINNKYDNDIKELSINSDEEPYSQISFKEFMFDVAGEDICVWNKEIATLLNGLTNRVRDKINVKNMFNGEKMYIELNEMLDRYKKSSFDIKSYKQKFNSIKSEEDTTVKMLKMYEFMLDNSIYDNYRIFKLENEISMRLSCIKDDNIDSIEQLICMDNYLHRTVSDLTNKHILIDFKINDYCIPHRCLFTTEEDDIEIPF